MFLDEEQKRILEDAKRSMKEERVRLLQEQVDEVMRMGRPEDSWWSSLSDRKPGSFKGEVFGTWGDSVPPSRTQHSKMTVTFEDGTVLEYKNCTVVQKRDGIEIRASVPVRESPFDLHPLPEDKYRFTPSKNSAYPGTIPSTVWDHIEIINDGKYVVGENIPFPGDEATEIPKNIKLVQNPVPNYIVMNTPEMKGVFEVPKEDSDKCRCNIMISGCTCGAFKREQEAKNG